MVRKNYAPVLPGATLLAKAGSCAQVARITGLSVRTIWTYRNGGKPSRRNRALLSERLSIPEPSWEPPPSPADAALIHCVNGLVAQLARLMRERAEELQGPPPAPTPAPPPGAAQ